MERGPLALFGAIVAVGLGPAMWLGAQFGQAIDTSSRPPTVSEQSTQRDPEVGGKAGSAPEDPTPIDLRARPRGDDSPTVRPSASASATRRGGPSPDPSASAPPSASVKPSTPAPESTTGPGDPPSEDDGGGPPEPSPPPSESTEGTGVGLPVL